MSYEQELKSHYEQVKARLNPKAPPISYSKSYEIALEIKKEPSPEAVKEPVHPKMYSRKLRTLLAMPTVGNILKGVIKKTGIYGDEIIGRSRSKAIVSARHMLMLELNEAGLSQSNIGRLLGLDHTTVCIAIRNYRAKMNG